MHKVSPCESDDWSVCVCVAVRSVFYLTEVFNLFSNFSSRQISHLSIMSCDYITITTTPRDGGAEGAGGGTEAEAERAKDTEN